MTAQLTQRCTSMTAVLLTTVHGRTSIPEARKRLRPRTLSTTKETRHDPSRAAPIIHSHAVGSSMLPDQVCGTPQSDIHGTLVFVVLTCAAPFACSSSGRPTKTGVKAPRQHADTGYSPQRASAALVLCARLHEDLHWKRLCKRSLLL